VDAEKFLRKQGNIFSLKKTQEVSRRKGKKAVDPISRADSKEKVILKDKHTIHYDPKWIIRESALGKSDQQIAADLGISEHKVFILKRRFLEKERKRLEKLTFPVFVLEVAEGFRQDMEKISQIIEEAKNKTVALQAVKLRSEVRQKYLELFQSALVAKKPTTYSPQFNLTLQQQTINLGEVIQSVDPEKRREFLSTLRSIAELGAPEAGSQAVQGSAESSISGQASGVLSGRSGLENPKKSSPAKRASRKPKKEAPGATWWKRTSGGLVLTESGKSNS